jgi:hypothetical protein
MYDTFTLIVFYSAQYYSIFQRWKCDIKHLLINAMFAMLLGNHIFTEEAFVGNLQSKQ